MRLLIKRLLDAGYVELSDQGSDGFVFVRGMRMDPSDLSITDEGRKFIQEIGSQQIDVT